LSGALVVWAAVGADEEVEVAPGIAVPNGTVLVDSAAEL